jgi:eukaryotic-like serine/threonine-protein kinase
MAEVWLARSFGVAGFEKRIVIKRILPGLARSPRFVRLFVQEARITAGLVHPNIVQIFELGRVGDDHYIAMEHVHGRDLTQVGRLLRQREERVPVALAVHIASSLLRGLAYAHALTDATGRPLHLVHRDVSPHNVMVGFQGDVKLFDFGIARLLGDKELAEGTGRPGGGKFAYMSPEQATGEPADRRSDIYSAGIVLYEMLVGHRLFGDPEPKEKLRRVQTADVPDPRIERPEVTDGLWHVLQRMLARDPEQRFSRAEEAEEALRAVLYESGLWADARTLQAWLADLYGPVSPPGAGGVDLAGLVQDVHRLRRTGTRPDPPEDVSEGSVASETTASGLDDLRVAPGECKSVCVLVADVLGMTDISARMEPEDVVRRHLRLLRRLRRSVGRHNGRIDRFQDDTLVVFFGLPNTGEDDLDRCLACARDLVRQARRLERTGLSVRLAIGVHRGEVTLGASGGRRLRYLARGDTIKLPARLSLEAEGGEVLVSDAVAALAQERWRMAEGPKLRQRGGRREACTWRLGGLRTGEGERRGRWVARGDEIAILGDALLALGGGQADGHGPGGALWVLGEAGTGKSRLLREIRGLARGREVALFAGRAAPYGPDRPLAPFRELVAEALDIEAGARPEAIRDRLGRLAHLGLAPPVRRVLAGLFAVEMGERAPTGGGGSVGDAAALFVQALARNRPVILAIEDVQHLHAEERALIGRVVDACRDLPVLFILTCREAPGAWADPPRWTIELGSLDGERLNAVAADALEARSVGAALGRVLGKTCEGNPLYAASLVQALAADGRISREDGVIDLRDPERPLTLPANLDGLIAARVDALPARCKAALQVAAVAGTRFSLVLMQAATGSADVEALIEQMIAGGLVTRDEEAPDGSFSFVSSLVWDAVRGSILATRRRECHTMVAHGISTLYRDNLDAHRHALALHLARSGRPGDAAVEERRAAEMLERQQQVEGAARAWERAVAWLAESGEQGMAADEAWMRLRAGECFALAGDPSRAELHLQVALDLSDEAMHPEVEARAHLGLGSLNRGRGRGGRAAVHFEAASQVVSLGGPLDPAVGGWVREVAVHALEGLGRVLHDAGDVEQAEARFQEALELATGDPSLVARALAALALVPVRRGDSAAALPLLEAAQEAAREGGDRILLGRVLNNIGAVHHSAGRHVEALACFRDALAVRQGLGYREGVAVNLHNVADTLLRMGEVARAWASFAHSRDVAREAGWQRGVAMNEVYLAYIDAIRGDAGAMERLVEATDRSATLEDRESAAQGALLQGRVLMGQEKTAAAQTVLAAVRVEAEELGARALVAEIDACLATLQ